MPVFNRPVSEEFRHQGYCRSILLFARLRSLSNVADNFILFDNLEAVERDAGPALDRRSQRSIFDRLEWFRLAARHMPEGAPLVIKGRRGSAQCWIFLSRRGSSAHALSNWYCLRYAPVTHGCEDAEPPFDELADGLLKAGVSHLFLSPIAEDDPLPMALRRNGWLVRREHTNVSWRIDTRGLAFAGYWGSRPSRLRNTAHRKSKRAALELILLDRFDERAWADLEAVFDASWKQPEGSPTLIREFAQQESNAGSLRLGLAYKNGLAVAAQIWTIENGVATIHKLAYREDAKELSAGTILSMEMFRRALDEEQVEMVDFGVGDDGYKREWMSYCVPLYALSAYYPFRTSGVVGLVRAAGRKVLSHHAGKGIPSGRHRRHD